MMNNIAHNLYVLKDVILGSIFCFIGAFLPAMTPKRRSLVGKTAVVTGSNSGIGYGFALQLAEMGATVYLACRNEKKAVQAQADMLEACPGAIVKTLTLDNASFASVSAFAKGWNYGTIDILAHNAGVSQVPTGQDFTEDGFEYQYQVNFLSSFLLTHRLEDRLAKDVRVVFTSSIGSYLGRLSDALNITKTSDKIEAGFHTALPGLATSISKYAQTKLMQAAFARALQAHFDIQHDSKRLAYSFEPGLVQSNILHDSSNAPFDLVIWIFGRLMSLLGLEVRQGSATGVHLATSEAVDVVRNKGRYFDRMHPRSHPVDGYTQAKLDRLWARWSADCEISWLA